ncbi:YpdA family putative bacillithiol disulfide reductase [Lederbergia lenta]|uniref:FAD-dependent pyridine nucleotide-disulfide oxidoreductase n=1 Tax=Lederbergia lenta TaxID=1467 RepID=A0A2X4W0A7_LEDLE|nr:YpdA family putative bacillithiol disulfide reductase [Lederbergia lenta]MEC2324982.1 YpdA family putative bacillithiol disulfide reductase [Lederbergia lenta]SQI56521.1 FAD-dependent pyridine nucleotide-disulfide oxidoreductase [Lederbergia lenta]
MQIEDCIIVGGGPCGLAAAIALKEIGKNPLIIEKGNIVNAIYNYPTHQTFFSSSEKLSIGDVPFITVERKPFRNQALTYYREVARSQELRINRFETVENIQQRENGIFEIKTNKGHYQSKYVIIATGYYDQPNYMGISGEELDKVYHYFKEGHPYFDTEVAVIGGKNSAVDAALELHKAGAHVTCLYRGSDYSPSVKPWIIPEFIALVKSGEIKMEFNTCVTEITNKTIKYEVDNVVKEIPNDFVFAMTGYHPDHSFLRDIGVEIETETGKPIFDSNTMETNVSHLYIAGVIAAGNDANEIFIENGRFHGGQIAQAIQMKET